MFGKMIVYVILYSRAWYSAFPDQMYEILEAIRYNNLSEQFCARKVDACQTAQGQLMPNLGSKHEFITLNRCNSFIFLTGTGRAHRDLVLSRAFCLPIDRPRAHRMFSRAFSPVAFLRKRREIAAEAGRAVARADSLATAASNDAVGIN